MPRGLEITAEQVEEMKRLRAMGLGNQKIADEMGISVITVRRHIKRQPLMTRAMPGEICGSVKGETHVKGNPIEYLGKLKEIRKDIWLQGHQLVYKVELVEGRIKIYRSVFENIRETAPIAEFTFQDWQYLIGEVRQISEKLLYMPQEKQLT